MRSEFEPKRIREAKETLERQLDSVKRMQQMQQEEVKDVHKDTATVFERLANYLKRLF